MAVRISRNRQCVGTPWRRASDQSNATFERPLQRAFQRLVSVLQSLAASVWSKVAVAERPRPRTAYRNVNEVHTEQPSVNPRNSERQHTAAIQPGVGHEPPSRAVGYRRGFTASRMWPGCGCCRTPLVRRSRGRESSHPRRRPPGSPLLQPATARLEQVPPLGAR